MKVVGYITKILDPIRINTSNPELRVEKIQVGIETVEGEKLYVDVINSKHKVAGLEIGDKVEVDFSFRANDVVPGKIFNNLNCNSIVKV